MAKCGMCMGRGSYDDPPWGIRVCVLCHGTGHDDPNVELWDRKGNVRHDAVERLREARAQMQRIEQEHAAKSEFQREVEKLGASAATVAEPKDQQQTGLYRKFIVKRTDGRDLPGGDRHGAEYFVIDVTHDEFAKVALYAYARACAAQYPFLALDMVRRYGLED